MKNESYNESYIDTEQIKQAEWNEKEMQPNHIFFALDIGTRSVVGMIGSKENDTYKVLDYEQAFHKVRAMRDGQIEDIDLVSRAVHQVKSALEARLGYSLNRVSIAAAGRALKTAKATAQQDISEDTPISTETIRSVEYQAISVAQEKFSEELSSQENNQSFSCVGYSVSGYWLDGYPISNLSGHKGKNICAEIIAAFLPFTIMRSLYAVTSRCHLEVENMTLEPIAAINAIVPKDIRLLNIAIADIGAGTTDIAISKNGSIIAYDMVTTAGDEITEALMKHYLVDFDTGERIKRSLSNAAGEISFFDILGTQYRLCAEDIIQIIYPALSELCNSIAKSIIKLNEGSPVAVFLIGGGSQIPGICKILSEKLELPENRVALGGLNPYKNIELCSEALLSPEFVTPIGIGAISLLYHGMDFFAITVNEKRIMLLDSNHITVLDALLLAGIKATSLMGISPRPLTYYLNGEKQVDRGEPPIAGELYRNGQPASIETPIQRGDSIIAIPAKNGISPQLTIADLLKKMDAEMDVTVNGTPMPPDYQIRSMDEINLIPKPQIEEIVSVANSSDPVHLDSMEQEKEEPMQQTKLEEEDKKDSKTISVCLNDHWIDLSYHTNQAPCFFDLLNYSDIDPEHPQGNLLLKLNGSDASFVTVLKDGDHAKIGWEKR
ncbi:cell division protein FtsA [Sinanaerobacter sp. ZZT-01]|uniref:cell division protein FtsA n=1 Tax=Sinanaerobacter sp. ZZT-01 TaxID=3111540 RepID=UPI002D7962D8|nr:cell division protein FtsA [Sinanaerobacter sp. ZZT-01]WRR93581.1 cell division protein FtsA [Sinanaerobacter sp. ZZT-01]